MQTWNKRAVQSALVRLDQTGMIRRFRVRKRKSEDAWVICIQILREPNDEDLDNLGFRRQAQVAGTVDELLQGDDDVDDPMTDLGVDLLDDRDDNVADNSAKENPYRPSGHLIACLATLSLTLPPLVERMDGTRLCYVTES
jgi:hypothetical protein